MDLPFLSSSFSYSSKSTPAATPSEKWMNFYLEEEEDLLVKQEAQLKLRLGKLRSFGSTITPVGSTPSDNDEMSSMGDVDEDLEDGEDDEDEEEEDELSDLPESEMESDASGDEEVW